MINLSATLILVSFLTSAQAQVSGNGISEYSAQGKLVILRIVPGDKVAKLFVLGKKAAEADFKKDAKVLNVFLKNGATSEELRINDRGDYYEVQGVPKTNTPYELLILPRKNGHEIYAAVNCCRS
jgi:hypothetical protein